jgi:hypothetical protein
MNFFLTVCGSYKDECFKVKYEKGCGIKEILIKD